MLEIDFLDDLVQDKRHQTFALSPYHQHIIRTSFEQMIDHPQFGPVKIKNLKSGQIRPIELFCAGRRQLLPIDSNRTVDQITSLFSVGNTIQLRDDRFSLTPAVSHAESDPILATTDLPSVVLQDSFTGLRV